MASISGGRESGECAVSSWVIPGWGAERQTSCETDVGEIMGVFLAFRRKARSVWVLSNTDESSLCMGFLFSLCWRSSTTPQPHPAETRISLLFGRGSFPFPFPTRLSPYFLFSLFKLQSWLLWLVPSSPGDRTQRLAHAREALYHLATRPYLQDYLCLHEVSRHY